MRVNYVCRMRGSSSIEAQVAFCGRIRWWHDQEPWWAASHTLPNPSMFRPDALAKAVFGPLNLENTDTLIVTWKHTLLGS